MGMRVYGSELWRAARASAACAALAAGAFAALPAQAATVISAGEDGKVRFWNGDNGDMIRSLNAHDGKILCLAVSSDGARIATGGEDGRIKLWKAADGATIRTIENAHRGGVTALAFREDGQLLSGGADRDVKAWHADGAAAATYGGHSAAVVGVVQAGDFVVSTDREGKLLVHDRDGQEVAALETGHAGGLTANVTNPAQPVTYTAGKDGAVKYWSREARGEFDGGQGSAVVAMAVSRDGSRLASAGVDGKVRVWDTAALKAVATIDTGLIGGASALAFSADGALLFLGGADGKGQARDTATGDLLGGVDAHQGRVTGLILAE